MSEYQNKLDEAFGKSGSMEDVLKQGVKEGTAPGPGEALSAPPEPEAPVVEEPVETGEVVEQPEEGTEPTGEELENQALAEEEPEEKPEPKKPHRDLKAEARIAKLIKEREQLKGQLAAIRQSGHVPPPNAPIAQAAPVDPEAPNPANYPDGEKDIDYRVDVKFYQQEQRRKMESFERQKQEALMKHPDLPELLEMDSERVQSGIQTANPTVFNLLMRSEVSGDLWHYLLANSDEAIRIAKMDPVSTAREIGKIEAKLMLPEPAQPAPAATKKPLPPPPKPVKTTKPNTVAGNKNFGFTEY